MINLTKLVFLVKNSHFLIATGIFSSCSLFKTYLIYSLCSSLLSKQIIMSSRYTITNLSRYSPNTLLIRFWNVAGAFISLINGLMLFNYYAINLLQQLQNPRNDFNCVIFSNFCQLTIAFTFFESILIFPSLIINPTKLVFLVKNSHFLIATSIFSSYSLFKTYLIYSPYPSLFIEQIIIILRYTITNLFRYSPNILLIYF